MDDERSHATQSAGLRDALQALDNGGLPELVKRVAAIRSELGRSYPLDTGYPAHIANALRIEASCSGTAPSASAGVFSLQVAASSGLSYVRGLGSVVQRMTKPLILSGITGTGKSQPIATLVARIKHNSDLFFLLAEEENDKWTDGGGSTSQLDTRSVIHLNRVAKRNHSDTWQEMFDAACLYEFDSKGAKRQKDATSSSQNIVQVNDEFEDFCSMLRDPRATPKLLELFNAGETAERATLTGGVRTLVQPLVTCITAGHPPTIQANLFSKAHLTNGLGARMSVINVPVTSRRESRMVSVPGKEIFPLDYLLLAVQFAAVTDVGKEVTGSERPFAELIEGGPSRAVGEPQKYCLAFELERFIEASWVDIEILIGQEPGFQFDKSQHGGELEGDNANLNMKGAVVAGGALDGQVSDSNVLVSINGTKVSTAPTALRVIRHLSAFGSDVSNGAVGRDDAIAIDAQADFVLDVCLPGNMFSYLPEQVYMTMQCSEFTLEELTLEDFVGDKDLSAGIRVAVIAPELSSQSGIGVGFELYSCTNNDGGVVTFGGGFYKDGVSATALEMITEDEHLTLNFLPMHPSLQLRFASLTQEYVAAAEYHDHCADMLTSCLASSYSDEPWCKALTGKLAKVPGLLARELGISRFTRVGDELVRGAGLEQRGLGMADMGTMRKIKETWIKRCKTVGFKLVTAFEGTSREALIPQCLKFRITMADVRAAIAITDHDIISQMILVMGDGSGTAAFSDTVASIAGSPARSLLSNGTVVPSSDSTQIHKAVLSCSGADRERSGLSEGQYGQGRFLAASLVKEHVRNFPALKALFPNANCEAMVDLGRGMVQKGLIKAVHVHKNTHATSRRIWFELRDANAMSPEDLMKFSKLLRIEASMSLLAYKTARLSKPAASSVSNPAAATVKKYDEYRWPGPCCSPHPEVVHGINYGSWACGKEGAHISPVLDESALSPPAPSADGTAASSLSISNLSQVAVSGGSGGTDEGLKTPTRDTT